MVETFDSYAQSLPSVYKRTVGIIDSNSTLRQLSSDTTTIIGVSDSSVKDGEGSASYIIQENPPSDLKVKGSLAVDGAAEDILSYQTELFGVLAIMLIIKILKEGRLGATVKGEIYCDSESVVKKVNGLRHETEFPYSINMENCDKYNVISLI